MLKAFINNLLALMVPAVAVATFVTVLFSFINPEDDVKLIVVCISALVAIFGYEFLDRKYFSDNSQPSSILAASEKANKKSPL